MNDIETINRTNELAVAAAVPHILDRGHFAVLEYSGLQLLNTHERNTEAEANALACELGLQPGKRATVRSPSHTQLVAASTQPPESAPYSGPDFDPS